MRFLGRFVVLLALAAVVGGIALLSTMDLPPPTHRVEKIISNDRFDP